MPSATRQAESAAVRGYTGITNVVHVLGTGVANTIWASELCSRKQAGHLRASDLVESLLRS